MTCKVSSKISYCSFFWFLSYVNKINQSINHVVRDHYIVSVENMEKRLMSINVHKAPGLDIIPNWILSNFATVLSGPLASIVNSSIKESYVPPVWKYADVLPIPKDTPQKDNWKRPPAHLTYPCHI